MLTHEQSEYVFCVKQGNHVIIYDDHKAQADKVNDDVKPSKNMVVMNEWCRQWDETTLTLFLFYFSPRLCVFASLRRYPLASLRNNEIARDLPILSSDMFVCSRAKRSRH